MTDSSEQPREGEAEDRTHDEPGGAASQVAEAGEPAGSAADGAASADAGPTDTKSRFAAVMERKRADGSARAGHLDGTTKVGGATASHKTSRTFRRKSG